MDADSRLVRASLGGDSGAFGELVGRHSARAKAVVRRMLASDHEAEDVVQEAVLQAYLGLERLRTPSRFGAWLCGIAVNLAKMRLRGRRTVASLDELHGGKLPPATADADLEAAELLELVRAAVAVLPAAQRETVLMYYVDGLSAQEVAALLGVSPGAVRVRLHRARGQLREQLAGVVPSSRKEHAAMIEVTVEDVVVRVLSDPGGESPRLTHEHIRIVLLREREGQRLLPIWIGPGEGDALAFGLHSESMPRPLTADLTARLLEAAGARIDHVVVNSLREKTFYATIAVEAGGSTHELDARPSDALNLATRVGAPVFVDEAVLAEAAFVSEDVAEHLETETAQLVGEAVPGEWRSLSPDLVRALHPELPGLMK